MESVAIRLADHGTVFSTRSQGRELFRSLFSAGVPGYVEIEFAGVTAVGYSFADEFIAALLASRSGGPCEPNGIRFVGAHPPVERVIRGVLVRRGAADCADEMVVGAAAA